MAHRRLCISYPLAMGTLLVSSLSALAQAAPAEKPAVVAVEAEDFQFAGDWTEEAYKGERMLISPLEPGRHPAATAVEIPRAGRYRLWVRSIDFPEDRPGTRVCTASVAG